ncbi:MAG: hypothetical protein NVS1B2_03660 [Vulcanimicrobiaceae bacterium]
MCHRTVVHVQRAIEAVGIPTILITVEPTQTLQARPPRAVHPTFNGIGTPVGKPGDAVGQRALLERTFAALFDPIEPGSIRTFE